MPVTPAGDADAAEVTGGADAAGCDGKADAVPVAPTGETAAATGAMLDAGAVESGAVLTCGDAATAAAVDAAANGWTAGAFGNSAATVVCVAAGCIVDAVQYVAAVAR